MKPKIVLLDDFNQKVGGGQIIGSLTTQFGDKAPRHGWKIIEIYTIEYEQRRDVSGEDKTRP